VCALTGEESLIPLATRFNVGHRNQGLGPHWNLVQIGKCLSSPNAFVDRCRTEDLLSF
jgi:hypothetical protein